MPRQQSLFDFRRSQVDADQIRDLLATINPASTGAALGVTLTQAGNKHLTQLVVRLGINGFVHGLM
jgi:ribonuclease I